MNFYSKNEQKTSEHRLKQIQRINEKYGQINYEKQHDYSMQ